MGDCGERGAEVGVRDGVLEVLGDNGERLIGAGVRGTTLIGAGTLNFPLAFMLSTISLRLS